MEDKKDYVVGNIVNLDNKYATGGIVTKNVFFSSYNPKEEIIQLDAFKKTMIKYELQKEVYNKVYKFMVDNDITCEETIYQSDRVIENAYEFMSDLFKIIKPQLPNTIEEEQEEI